MRVFNTIFIEADMMESITKSLHEKFEKEMIMRLQEAPEKIKHNDSGIKIITESVFDVLENINPFGIYPRELIQKVISGSGMDDVIKLAKSMKVYLDRWEEPSVEEKFNEINEIGERLAYI